jgi:hypothetical protein
MQALKTVCLGIPLFIVFALWAVAFGATEILDWCVGELLTRMPCDND